MQVRPGELAFHGATSTLVTRSTLRAAFFVHTEVERPTADISVASYRDSSSSNRVRDRCESTKAAKIGSAGAS